MNLRTIALTIVVAALAGCAAPQISLTKQAQTNIDRVEGVLTIPQNNLDVTVQATNPGNSGLLGALIAAAIDSSRQSSAEKAAAPMLEPLRDYDFRAVMLNALTDALTKIDKVKIAMPQRVEVVASDSSKRIAFDQSTASSILFCYVGYRLESGNLIVTASAEMYPKIERLKQFRNKPEEANPLDSGNVIYRKTFVFTKQAVTPITIKETQIRDRLAALAPEALDLLDESALHVGHAEATGGGHYRLKIISAQFAGQSHVARHRMVYAILEPLMRHRHIHALALVTQAPGES